MASGLYLPKSHRELREQQEARMQADQLTQSLPDFKDAMELQRALKLRDERMSVTWAQSGPHMNRWVVVRTDDQGMPHIVMVIKNVDQSYKSPSYKLADSLIDTWGRSGSLILKQMDDDQARRSAEAERLEDEAHAEVAERIGSLVMSVNGVKDRAFIS